MPVASRRHAVVSVVVFIDRERAINRHDAAEPLACDLGHAARDEAAEGDEMDAALFSQWRVRWKPSGREWTPWSPTGIDVPEWKCQ